ncbi:MAG: DUF445 domain-containing protein [Mycobacteriales bacterium]
MTLTPTELTQRRGLRRMKTGSTGLLLFALLGYVLAARYRDAGGPGWTGYVAAAAEAGVVGGLADWFAVTALFRHPLGLPIPHTALLPNRKKELGRSLQSFIATNFLSESVIRDKIARAGVTGRFAGWLAQPSHAARVVDEAAVIVRGAVTVLRDEDVQRLLESVVVDQLRRQPSGPPAGRLLDAFVQQGSAHHLLDLVIDKGVAWLTAHRETLLRVVSEQAPGWTPRFIDRKVAGRVHVEVLRFLAEVRADPRHRMRQSLDDYLRQLAHDLQHDPATMTRADAVKERLLQHPELRTAVAGFWGATKRMILDAAADPHHQLRAQAVRSVQGLGVRLRDDDALQAKVDHWIENVGTYLVTTYRDDVTTVITDTIDRWDAKDTARKVELQVGRDLQYIRINGTVVGSLAGLVLFSLSQLLL